MINKIKPLAINAKQKYLKFPLTLSLSPAGRGEGGGGIKC
jgi:hypothetical protein